MTLEELLTDLACQGCYPCLSLRGWEGKHPIWRAHINGTGNYWCDGITPHEAFALAWQAWLNAGKPMDGYAATEVTPNDCHPKPDAKPHTHLCQEE